jgi:hypothetical protein
MITKTGNESISAQVTVNRKTINKTTYYDEALHIKNKFRVLRDLSTDCVIDTLFRHEYKAIENHNLIKNYNNSIKRNLFLMYVYDYFNLNIISDFEYYLLTNNCEILNSEYEYIKFLFKGGNVYFHIVNELIERYNIFNGITEDQKNTIIDELSKAFKISDFDFTINLYCITHNKFIKVKKYLVEFIIKKMEEITMFFNGYVSSKLKNSPIFTESKECFTPTPTPINIHEQNNKISICLNSKTQIKSQSNNLTLTQTRSLTILKIINDLLSELYNNIFFRSFILAIDKNTNENYNLDIILSGNFNDDLLEYYAKLVSTFEINKIKSEINEMLIIILLINDLLKNQDLYTSFNEQNTNKEFNAMIICVFLKISFINDYYNSTKIFKIEHSFNLNIYQKKQNDYFKHLEQIFDEIDFYSDDSFMKIIQSIATTINDKIFVPNDPDVPDVPRKYQIYAKEPNEDFLFKVKSDYKDESNYQVIRLTKNSDNQQPYDITDVTLCPANDILFQQDNYDIDFYIRNNGNNFHYITYNSTIYMMLAQSMTNFDLIRSKLNFKLANVNKKKYLSYIDEANDNIKPNSSIKIPSEFIDISISNFEDSFYQDFIKKPDDYIMKYDFTINLTNYTTENDRKFSVNSLTIEYFIHDLIKIIFFDSVVSHPWIDIKYEKRLFRLFFLYAVHNKNESVKYLLLLHYIAKDMDNKINNNNYSNDLFETLRRYDDDDFKDLCRNVCAQKIDLRNFHFCDNNLYFHQIDEVFNCLFFCFSIYLLYHTGEPELALETINIQRKLHKYYEFESTTEYETKYHNKIKQFVVDVLNKTKIVLIQLGIIGANLPNIIP